MRERGQSGNAALDMGRELWGGEFSPGEMRNFHPALTQGPIQRFREDFLMRGFRFYILAMLAALVYGGSLVARR